MTRYIVTEIRVWEVLSAGSEEQAIALAEVFEPDTIQVQVEELPDDDANLQ